ncbi:MAG TPA: DEAD/DEAH box helicase [Verrucomicrobiae bacterium]|nr:DEAD/DEAH box helicase [Verrucomicrobiae bacterium]
MAKELLNGIERFLAILPPKLLKRGRGYYARGDVLSVTCSEPNRRYSAVVRGGENYKVELSFADNAWFTKCSCPMNYDCKHVVAAMHELERLAGENGKTAAVKQKAPSRNPDQPSNSPLADRLTAALGRKLRQPELNFVRQIQSLYQVARYRQLTERDLGMINPRWYFSYQPLNLWPQFPSDDFYCWLFIAWELRRGEVPYPDFMEAITDFSLIEKEIIQWQRDKEIDRWKGWFQGFDPGAPQADAGTLDLRLMVLPKEARLQWRTDAASEFLDLKQSQAKRFAEQFESGSLQVTPEALPLWSAVFKPWNYESWWSFKYENSTSRPALNRLLRMPLAPDRVVDAEGRPFPRVAEPLRLRLRAPEKGDDDYELALATGDDSSLPEIFCTLSGRPALYVTDRGLFHGPSAEALEAEPRKTIPAEALETIDGIRFLHATGVPLPDHLAKRVRTVPVIVTISCDLKQGYRSEEIVVSVAARATGIKRETLTPQGWTFQQTLRDQNLKTEKGVLTIHDRSAQRHFPRLLESLGGRWDGYPALWKLRLTKKTPEVFVPWLKSIPPEIEVQLDKELATLRDEPLTGEVSLDVAEAGIDWFDLKVVLNVTDATLTPEELKLLLNARGGYVRLGEKGWRRLRFNFTDEDDEQLARLGLNPKDFSSEPQRFHALQLADDAAKKFLSAERVEKIQRRASELKMRVAPPLSGSIRADMRPYQVEGFHFLAYLTANHFGGVLADDMGLGKTLQTLAWLAWLRESPSDPQNPVRKTALVVCPKSVMDNWRAEAERFYPGLRVRLWRGEGVEELPAARESCDLIVMNYAQLRALSGVMANTQWLAAILDEAQYIKNPDSQTAQVARSLQADHRLALTGTPIENRLLDLWSILAFAMPGVLGNRAHFLRRFNSQDDPLARRRLAARVRPVLLRRAKSQVAKDLPDRVEEDLLCEMEGEQRLLYRAELKRARQILLGLKTNQQLNEERFNILTSLLRLRQICCHPALVDGKLREAESAKVSALEDLLEPLMEEGNKVLVFSQFVTMLDILRETVQGHEWPHFYLAGDTENRGELVREFQSAKGGAVFLISLKAGGFGLNLTAASYVVLFDPWWNPAVENQAIDRTHRIGQVNKVMAYRLLMRESIEQKIRALQRQKAALVDDVFGEERFSQSLSLDDLRFLFSD